jgi:cobalamin biosynthesis protein CbiG
MRVRATASPKGGNYFAPLITNETGKPLTITINAGLAGAMSCSCTVPPGAVRMEIGYYALFANSTVRAEEVGGLRTATFKDLGPQVDATTGRVGLLFRAVDLR